MWHSLCFDIARVKCNGVKQDKQRFIYGVTTRGVTGIFFWGGKVIFPDFFPGVKCFFPGNFGRPKTNFHRFQKWKQKKKKKKKKLLISFL